MTMASGGNNPTPAELESLVFAVREASNATNNSVDLPLTTAAVKTMQTHSLTPLIKEELKIMIQKNRLAEGKPELTVEFKEPEDVQLTEEDIRRRERRKERNRLAAQKCRTKRREISDVLEQQCSSLENDNACVKSEIDQLQQEILKLQQIKQRHDMHYCPVGSVTNNNNNL
eukprot:GHVR01051898.1.p1 GENE.GHVR01051898.1~~GHVR01051898.1.p1  ORF type:complete len:172 (+),score=33.22 GHVR01051898.1:2-517(+)